MADEYCTQAQMIAACSTTRLAEFTEETGSTPAPTSTDLPREEQSRFMDGFLASVVVVPVTDAATLAILRPHAVVLVMMELYNRRDIEPTEGFLARYKATLKWLEAVAKGDITLPASATPIEPAEDVLDSRCGGETPTFTSPDPLDLDNPNERLFS